jgi:hypothetical protein
MSGAMSVIRRPAMRAGARGTVGRPAGSARPEEKANAPRYVITEYAAKKTTGNVTE